MPTRRRGIEYIKKKDLKFASAYVEDALIYIATRMAFDHSFVVARRTDFVKSIFTLIFRKACCIAVFSKCSVCCYEKKQGLLKCIACHSRRPFTSRGASAKSSYFFFVLQDYFGKHSRGRNNYYFCYIVIVNIALMLLIFYVVKIFTARTLFHLSSNDDDISVKHQVLMSAFLTIDRLLFF